MMTDVSDSVPARSDLLGRFLRAVVQYPRRSPATLTYLALLTIGTVVVKHVLPGPTADRIFEAISTNLDNLPRHPVTTLFGSLLVLDDATWLDNLLVVGLGISVCLALLERRLGALRALGAALLAHVSATLITLVVVSIATRAETYPADSRHALDYGVSYASIAAVAAVTPLLPRRGRPWWCAVAVLYPLTAAQWYGWLPDFTTIGHISAALIGLAMGFAMFRTRSTRETAESVSSA
ncbi:rhomboid-like protein [Streptomyces sp. NL15-2K]|uniref:rhomboid-like protein n=1 Tax=Streptomyces sp. NL15-2K TaxID=376149 RepID=UPI000F57ED4A|nr:MULTISPECIES: rhomboid-like protein [Actinomycetes]WKX09483.1 hypothetical protein Q4V64_19110 [Kutzneria buriramensis]